MTRTSKAPRFDVNFPEKSGEKMYVNFDLDYILRYAEDLPLKYHPLKAEYILRLAEEVKRNEEKKRLEELKSGEEETEQTASQEIKETTQSAAKEKGKHAQKVVPPASRSSSSNVDHSALAHSDMESDSESEDEDGDDVDMAKDKSNNEHWDSFTNFSADKWEVNELPIHPNHPFLGNAGLKHTLSAQANPFQYFCLFIPTYFWARWATYTNAKAAMAKKSDEEKGRPRKFLCEAEIKA